MPRGTTNFSLPIPPGTILLARMTGLYLLTLFFQVLVLLPAGIVYARYAGLTAGGAVSWLVALGLLTLLTLAPLESTQPPL